MALSPPETSGSFCNSKGTRFVSICQSITSNVWAKFSGYCSRWWAITQGHRRRLSDIFVTTLYAPGMHMSHIVVVDGLDSLERVIIRDPGRGTHYLML